MDYDFVRKFVDFQEKLQNTLAEKDLPEEKTVTFTKDEMETLAVSLNFMFMSEEFLNILTQSEKLDLVDICESIVNKIDI